MPVGHTDQSYQYGQSDIFAKNMELLKKYHPQTWTMIHTAKIKPEGEIVYAKNGEPNIITNNADGNQIFMHIVENPGSEADDILAQVQDDFHGTLILTGMGLGYCPLALSRNRNNLRHLIFFEPNAGIFLQALKAKDLTTLLSDPRVILGIGENQDIAATMAPASKALQLENIQHMQHNASFSLDFSKYNALYENINNHTIAANIEGNTFLKMGNDFFTNRLKHLNSIHHDYSMDDLAEIYNSKPAIIVAAGPSLDKNIHLLQQVKNRAIIIAVDSALPSLIANDIMPTFLTTIDPLELIFEKVAPVANKAKDISLICMSWASSKMAKLFPAKKKFWCFGSKHIEKWMADLIGCRSLTAGATSVAHLNLFIAIWMKCSPIIFVGQDLSFSESKSHSTDMALPTKDLIKNILNNEKEIVWLDGIHGGKVPSNQGFHRHKRFFETIIEKEEGNFINSTAEGCHIKGTKVIPLQEALDRYCTSPIDTADIYNVLEKKQSSIKKEHLTNKLEKKLKKCNEIRRMLKETEHLLRDLIKVLNKAGKLKNIYKNINDLSVSNQKKIMKLDKIGKKLDNSNDIWSLMQEVTLAGLKQSEQQKYAIDRLGNDPEQYTQWLKKNFERLNTINKVRQNVLPLFQDTLAEDINILQSETKFLSMINRQKDIKKYHKYLSKLITLYFDSDNIALAQPWLKILYRDLPDSAEANFYQGITAAHYTEYDKAESFFNKAVKADQAYSSRIEKFRNKQGNAYISYALIFDKNDKTIARRLLLKGLIYAPEHKKVKQELKSRSHQTIIEIKTHEKKERLAETEDMIDAWLEDLSSFPKLSSIIGDSNTAHLNYYKGVILIGKENFDSGIDHFIKASHITPDNPVIHISLTDAYFATADYAKGIAHLNKAVAIDTAYAVYFEAIGDELMKTNQIEDARTAFENCFVALPGHVHLLKKIGDCYKKTGQLEAAKEAYENLNALLKAS